MQSPFRLALVSDMLEEKWYSMDLIADMLFDQLASGYGSQCSVRQIRPALKRLSSGTWLTQNSSSAWMLDRLLNRHVTYPRFLRAKSRNFDLFHIVDHSYANLVNGLPAERSIVTCHDLDAFRCILDPSAGTRARLLRSFARRALRGMQKAAHTIFVSHAVRKAALQQGLVSEAKSSVVPMGVHPSCTVDPDRVADQTAAELIGHSGRRPLLLHVGSTVYRKRLDVVLRVTAQVAAVMPETLLVRVGGPLSGEQRRLAENLQLAGRMIELPYLERNVLAAVYRRADLVLQPSEAEGFGLPVVEAMACGCPVVASDLDVLREVGGTMAAYCPVGDVDRWSECVLNVLKGSESCDPRESNARRQHIAGHARQFSWEETTKQVVRVYEQVVATRGMNSI